jgi:hypothetical protein
MIPSPNHIWFRFPVLTSSLFIRRKVIQDRGLFFDTSWRVLGDLHWVRGLIRDKVPMAVIDFFTSVFTDTGENLALSPSAKRESDRTAKLIPLWVRGLKPFWILMHRLRRIPAGHFSMKPTSYSIFTLKSPKQRVCFDVSHPTPIWRNRL